MGDPEREDANKFLVEEHHCPTNLLRCWQIVAHEDGFTIPSFSTDVHGLFEYVREVNNDDAIEWSEITGKPTIETT